MGLGTSLLASSLHPLLMWVVQGQTHTHSWEVGREHQMRALPWKHDSGDQPSSPTSAVPARKVQDVTEQSGPCLWGQEASVLTLISLFWAGGFPSLCPIPFSEKWRTPKFPVVRGA